MLWIAIATGLAGHAAALGMAVFSALTFPYRTHHFFEWDVLQQAILLSQGMSPYLRGDLTFATSCPYQFLYPLVCAGFIRIFGPHFWIGRVLSLVSLAAILIMVYRALRYRYRLAGRYVAVGLILSFLVPMLTGYSLLKFHPNTMCIAAGLLSLSLSPAAHRPLRSWLPALAAGLACFFLKQYGLFFLVAVLAVMIREHGWKGMGLAAAVLAAGLAVLFAANAATAGDYFAFCYSLPAKFRLQWDQAVIGIRFLGGRCFLFLVPSLPYLLRRRAARDPFLAAAALSVPVSLYGFAVAGGTDTNFAFSLFLLGITAARAAAAAERALRRRARLGPTAAAALAVQMLLAANRLILPGPQDRAAARHLAETIGQPGERVLALDLPEYAFFAGKPVYTTVDAMGLFLYGGVTTYPAIEEMIRSRQFDLVVIREGRFLFQGEGEVGRLAVLRLLPEHYRTAEVVQSPGTRSSVSLLRPKSGARVP